MEDRRNFLKNSLYTAVAGVTVATGLQAASNSTAEAAVGSTKNVHPYGYLPLDGDEIRQRAYDSACGLLPASDGSSHNACAFGVFNAIIGRLAELDPNSGHANIPTQMMEWGAGGVAGYGSICGALNGACAAIGLICANNDAKLFISDLLTWYSEALLPTPLSQIYLKPLPGFETVEIAESVAASNLCHSSVTSWCKVSGIASSSPLRKERCKRLVGDVAAKVVELLNSGIGGTYGNPRDNSSNCGQCHYSGPNYDAGQNTRGKMNCYSCHVDIKKVGENGHRFGKLK